MLPRSHIPYNGRLLFFENRDLDSADLLFVHAQIRARFSHDSKELPVLFVLTSNAPFQGDYR